jgi:hypothetical protein
MENLALPLPQDCAQREGDTAGAQWRGASRPPWPTGSPPSMALVWFCLRAAIRLTSPARS